MNGFNAARIAVLALCLGLPPFLAGSWADAAGERLRAQQRAEKSSEDEGKQVAVASAADKKYCNAGLKKILRRVLRSCGLLESGAGTQRGCEPADAESVAEMSGSDFNALFKPMKERGGIVQFDQESAELDRGAKKLLGELFADRRGASYFLVVARASTEGAADYNRKLSKKRAN
ncbi:MAG: hypothetical protein ABEL76_17400, partial [Bradymonadaceae bacterium]